MPPVFATRSGCEGGLGNHPRSHHIGARGSGKAGNRRALLGYPASGPRKHRMAGRMTGDLWAGGSCSVPRGLQGATSTGLRINGASTPPSGSAAVLPADAHGARADVDARPYERNEPRDAGLSRASSTGPHRRRRPGGQSRGRSGGGQVPGISRTACVPHSACAASQVLEVLRIRGPHGSAVKFLPDTLAELDSCTAVCADRIRLVNHVP